MDEPGNYTNSIQIIGIMFSLFFLISVFFLVRANRIQEKYSIAWFFVALFILLISLFRDFIEWFSHFVGIYYAPSAFFSILISCAYMLLLSLSINISTLKKQNKSLIQELGLLKQKVEELEAGLEGSGKNKISDINS